jgi:hypothetical protein
MEREPRDGEEKIIRENMGEDAISGASNQILPNRWADSRGKHSIGMLKLQWCTLLLPVGKGVQPKGQNLGNVVVAKLP